MMRAQLISSRIVRHLEAVHLRMLRGSTSANGTPVARHDRAAAPPRRLAAGGRTSAAERRAQRRSSRCRRQSTRQIGQVDAGGSERVVSRGERGNGSAALIRAISSTSGHNSSKVRRDRQARPGPRTEGRRHSAGERLEIARACLGDDDAAVGDEVGSTVGSADRVSASTCTDSAALGELDGVADQIDSTAQRPGPEATLGSRARSGRPARYFVSASARG